MPKREGLSVEELLEILLKKHLENSGHTVASQNYREKFFNKHRKIVTVVHQAMSGGATTPGEGDLAQENEVLREQNLKLNEENVRLKKCQQIVKTDV